MHRFTVVSFYTLDTPYSEEAERLIESCQRFGIRADVRGVPNLGSWQRNCQYKAEFLRSMRQEMAGPLVWIDADGEVVAPPTAFDVLDDYDLAVHYRAGVELLSGTVWIGDTPTARTLMDNWVMQCRARPDAWDQATLATAVGSTHGLRLHKLPAPYCLIFDLMKNEGPPVILHHQASRRFKRLVYLH